MSAWHHVNNFGRAVLAPHQLSEASEGEALPVSEGQHGACFSVDLELDLELSSDSASSGEWVRRGQLGRSVAESGVLAGERGAFGAGIEAPDGAAAQRCRGAADGPSQEAGGPAGEPLAASDGQGAAGAVAASVEVVATQRCSRWMPAVKHATLKTLPGLSPPLLLVTPPALPVPHGVGLPQPPRPQQRSHRASPAVDDPSWPLRQPLENAEEWAVGWGEGRERGWRPATGPLASASRGLPSPAPQGRQPQRGWLSQPCAEGVPQGRQVPDPGRAADAWSGEEGIDSAGGPLVHWPPQLGCHPPLYVWAQTSDPATRRASPPSYAFGSPTCADSPLPSPLPRPCSLAGTSTGSFRLAGWPTAGEDATAPRPPPPGQRSSPDDRSPLVVQARAVAAAYQPLQRLS